MDMELLKARMDLNRSRGILNAMEERNADIQIYASDGTGIRKVDDLLSDDQLIHIQGEIEKYLEELIIDIEDMEGMQ